MDRIKKYVYCLYGIIVLIFCCSANAQSVRVSPEQEKIIFKYANMDLRLNPYYGFGSRSKKPGDPKDCSGSIWAYFSLAKVKNDAGKSLPRSIAGCMSEGKDRWDFPVTSFDKAKRLALVFTTPKKRCSKYCILKKKGRRVEREYPCSRTHVQFALKGTEYGKVMKVFHASSKYGLIATLIKKDDKDYWYPKIDVIRQVIWDRK